MSRWFLVRHGATPWNLEGRVQGHTDTPMSEVGLCQVKRLTQKLAGTPFSVAYSSDLSRALKTAELVLRGRNIPLHRMPELRELNYGVWEGMTYQDTEAQYPSLYSQLMAGDPAFSPPGGESVEDLFQRVQTLGYRLKAAHTEGENILVVGQGGSLRGLLCSLLDLPLSRFWRFQLAPGSLSILSIYPQDATLDLWNDTSHLEEAHAG